MANKNYLTQFASEGYLGRARLPERLLHADLLPGIPLRRTGARDRLPTQRRLPPAAGTPPASAQAAARLGIEPGKRVILYAPTWRDNQYDRSGRYQFAMKLDLERMHREFADDAVLLIRGHQLVADSVDTSMFGDFARNVSHYPDISDLYLVADVLVTDYSSVMFDFVNTGRPMLFFTHDLEAYRDDLRGFYIDPEAEAPGTAAHPHQRRHRRPR